MERSSDSESGVTGPPMVPLAWKTTTPRFGSRHLYVKPSASERPSQAGMVGAMLDVPADCSGTSSPVSQRTPNVTTSTPGRRESARIHEHARCYPSRDRRRGPGVLLPTRGGDSGVVYQEEMHEPHEGSQAGSHRQARQRGCIDTGSPQVQIALLTCGGSATHRAPAAAPEGSLLAKGVAEARRPPSPLPRLPAAEDTERVIAPSSRSRASEVGLRRRGKVCLELARPCRRNGADSNLHLPTITER